MNIKGGRTMNLRGSFKFPKLMFHAVSGNFTIALVLFALGINEIIGLNTGTVRVPPLIMLTIVLSTVLLIIGMQLGPGEALRKKGYNYDQDIYDQNVSDFKRAGVYTLIYTVMVLGSFYYNQYTNNKPLSLTKSGTTMVKSIKLVDKHTVKADSYGIRFYGVNLTLIWSDNYKTLEERDLVISRMFKNGKMSVKPLVYNNNGYKSLKFATREIVVP